MIEMISQFCVINLEFHDAVGEIDNDDRIAIIVHAKDFNTINFEIEERVDADELVSVDDFLNYLVSLDDRGIYYREVSKFYLHEINPGE
jgi:hypothetical protein